MSAELKPCPFCGGPAVASGDGCSVGCAYIDCPGNGGLEVWWETPEEAADAWNSRAVDTDALLALADRFECGSSDFMTRKEIAYVIRKAVGVGYGD